ncbi:MAG: HAMP domain-containing sensor histidine kinase [Pseudomonadota bacterium]
MNITKLASSLSAKLLVLTIIFVLLAEIMIFAPSVGRYRLVYFQERLDQAYLATLAIDVSPDHMVSEMMESELLATAGAHVIMRMSEGEPDTRLAKLVSAQTDVSYDIRNPNFLGLIVDAFATMVRQEDQIVEVIGTPSFDADITLKVQLDEAPLRQRLIEYAIRIFWLSIFISGVAAIMVFFALRGLLVRPLQDMVASMEAFRAAPESDAGTITISGRRDEMGTAERELAALQDNVRQALRQKTRLALLGTAVAKINHDLRNILSTAALLSERLSDSDDEKVAKVAPRLETSINRAIELCSETLKFSRDGIMSIKREPFDLKALIGEVREELLAHTPDEQEWDIDNRIGEDIRLNADRGQLYRVIANLTRNALEAGALTVTIKPVEGADPRSFTLEIADNGPGLPPRAKENLFVPFAGSVRGGGTGLGLTIAREIARAHGGDLSLVKSDSEGTAFRLILPNPGISNRATAKALSS